MEFWIFVIVGVIVLIFYIWIESVKFAKKLKKYQTESDKYLKNKNFSFSKRIPIDIGNQNKLEFIIDDNKKQFALLSCKPKTSFLSDEELISEENFSMNIFNFSDMINFELLLDNDEVLQGRGLAATGGALLFGAAGAVIGSSGQRKVLKTNRSIVINIYLNKIDCPVITINFPTVIRNDFSSVQYYDLQLQQAKTLQGVLYYIEQQNKNTKQMITRENDITSKIKQINELKEQGLISDEEFENKRKKLLDNL